MNTKIIARHEKLGDTEAL